MGRGLAAKISSNLLGLEGAVQNQKQAYRNRLEGAVQEQPGWSCTGIDWRELYRNRPEGALQEQNLHSHCVPDLEQSLLAFVLEMS